MLECVSNHSLKFTVLANADAVTIYDKRHVSKKKTE